MTYLKMVTKSARKHLAPAEHGEVITTLCGCTVTRRVGWRAVTSLEGDECEKCADLSFPVSKLRSWLAIGDHASRETEVTKQPQ